jgi:hypothetical protein
MNDANARRIAVRALSAGAGVVGAVLGYDIGDRISGTLLAVVMAAMAGVFGALMGGAAADWLFAKGGKRGQDDRQ